MTTPSNPDPQLIGFAFPFRDAKGKDIVDEHVFYDWLANEANGNFAISGSGMWHGGIHVSADGAGMHLDLGYGVRCIADGEVVAYRINGIALVSQIAAGGGKPAQTGYYSSAFTLVRHTLEYPANNRLTFFSLYMHLQSLADYKQKSMVPPSYWARSYEVTQNANDKPAGAPHHGVSSTAQAGLNIHSTARSSTILGILPRGARVRIGERDQTGKWGKIEAIEAGAPMPPKVGGAVQPGADKGWVYLQKERGHFLLSEVVSEMQCDQVVVLPQPVKIKAGDLIGHLGQYWLPGDPVRDNTMVHIEVFSDDTLSRFLSASRDAAGKITDFSKLPLLRIDRGVKLFKGHSIDEEGENAPETAVVQIYSQAALDALPAACKGPTDNAYGHGEPWWYVTSANSRYEDIPGWVRNRQMPSGRVTRESPHAWKDFETVTGSDAGNPTMFSTVDAWLDHVLCEDKPATGDVSMLKPLTCSVYRELSPMRNERQAADELRAHKDNKWLRFRASRLIPKHRNEWASQSEYETFFDKVLKRVAKEPYHDAELERIRKLVWWDEAKGKNISGFPSNSEVFHIHPIALVGNFIRRHAQASGRFPSEVIEAAQAAQTKWSIPASVSLGQWAFESGYGHHMPPGSNNPFGIKANRQDLDSGNYVNAMTSEVVHGERIHVPQPFRRFQSMADAFDYHGRLLATGSAYALARAHLPDPYAFANGLTGHYATEPNYGQKLIDGYIRPNDLTQYD